MKFQLLYFDDCAFWQTGLKNLKIALQLEGIPPKVELVRLNDEAEAVRLKFLGSPSFRVDGTELWPEERRTYGLMCRLYQTGDGMQALPSVSMLRQKLRELMTAERDFERVRVRTVDPILTLPGEQQAHRKEPESPS